VENELKTAEDLSSLPKERDLNENISRMKIYLSNTLAEIQESYSTYSENSDDNSLKNSSSFFKVKNKENKRADHLNKKRNSNLDVILKKIISRFFKYVHFDLICPCVDQSLIKLKSLKLNQKFVTDVSFVTVKNYIHKPLKVIYSEKGRLRNFFNDENLRGILQEKKEFIRMTINRNIDDLYEEFLDSDRFQIELEKFERKKNSHVYIDKYIKTAYDFLNFF
jgi:hypothetical protein